MGSTPIGSLAFKRDPSRLTAGCNTVTSSATTPSSTSAATHRSWWSEVMYRYFVLNWNPVDPQAVAPARSLWERLLGRQSGWKLAFDSVGLAAFHADLDAGASDTLLLDQ